MVGDDDNAVPSRAGTPRPEVAEKQKNEATLETQNGEGAVVEGSEMKEGTDGGGTAPAPHADELPTEVRVKLRKYDRLESRYEDLLRAYRTAHARVQLIEPFEASLRENTPLTSIKDPSAFLEYLNQVNLKGDMVLDELKRVSADRDEYKKKFELSEENALDLKQELDTLREERRVSQIANGVSKESEARPSLELSTTAAPIDKSKSDFEPSIKSPAPSTSSRMASFSIFSPKIKVLKSPPTKETTDSTEFFSYDNELPQLESQLQEREVRIDDLRQQVDTLKEDLAVARSSTDGMAQTVESLTCELQTLRDAKDKLQSLKDELQTKLEALQAKCSSCDAEKKDLERRTANLQKEVDQRQQIINDTDEVMITFRKGNIEREEKLEEAQRSVADLCDQLSMKDATVKDLEDSLAMYKSTERQEAKTEVREQSSEKQILILQNIMETLRNQLKEAGGTIESLKSSLREQQDEFDYRPSSRLFSFLDREDTSGLERIHNREEALRYLASRQTSNLQNEYLPETAPPPALDGVGAGSGKKKNRKKKKGKGGHVTPSDTAVHEGPIKVTEDLGEAEEANRTVDDHAEPHHDQLRKDLADLRVQLVEKERTIDQLTIKLRDQESLREEIETLRDDLLHQGEEHVEARDALKAAHSESESLTEEVNKLGKEVLEVKTQAASASGDSEKARNDLLAELQEMKAESNALRADLAVVEQLAATREEQLAGFGDLKVKSTTLQTDLSAVEQLAAARFRDIMDLREVLSKMQLELRNLKKEAEIMKSVEEDLHIKNDQLHNLELRHEDLHSETARLRKAINNRTSEISDLNKQIAEETSARSKAEGDLRIAQSDLRYSEARKQEAIETCNQTSKDHASAREETTVLRSRLQTLEDQMSSHAHEVAKLKEEISLQTSLHESAQNYAQSLRDQTHELGTQAREAGSHAESLEEELAETQRMLSERTREGETMRRLLSEAESKSESRTREMRERMEKTIEERDRTEDEASTNGRRLAREMEDLKHKARDATKAFKDVEEEKEELERAAREWKRRREGLEKICERSAKELEEVRGAMKVMRDALDESERQIRELEASKSDLRKANEERTARIEKLATSNKSLADEVKMLQRGSRKPGVRHGLDSSVQSSRSSLDSPSAGGGLGSRHTNSSSVLGPGSPAANRPSGDRSEQTLTGAGTGLSAGTVDYVYLKNVLLQFLEQRDKSHQRQLVPVLGMLLHFDR